MNHNKRLYLSMLVGSLILLTACSQTQRQSFSDPVDYVNVNLGGISHLLVPTYPTVHLPNAMMRMTPNREDYACERLSGLPLILTSHRGVSAFALSPLTALSDSIPAVRHYSYDAEHITPYRYRVRLDDEIAVHFAPSFQSAIYRLDFEDKGNRYLVMHTPCGMLKAERHTISGYQTIGDSTRVYIYMQTDAQPTQMGVRDSLGRTTMTTDAVSGGTLVMAYSPDIDRLSVRYGISYISIEQAQKNLLSQIQAYDVDVVAKKGRNEWNKALGKIEVEGGTNDDRQVFYTALYRTYERMVCISEDGQYYSAYDGQVHQDGGIPFYTDDWVWDTYRATHPLRLLIEPEKQRDMITSYIRMAEQSADGWLPTFPEVTGDSHRMNGSHTISVLADAYAKGLTDFDLTKAYEQARATMMHKSLIPWRRIPKGRLDEFFDQKGYFPALKPGEAETDPTVTLWEKRQSVAVTLAAAYDYWSLARLAQFAGREDEYQAFLRRSYCYRNLFNYDSGFFHPRSADGQFVEPFDYRFAGGQGCRDYYDENNAYTYRWDVAHNPADLIYLMGGKEKFCDYLEETLTTPLGQPKFIFYRVLPDQTGNVGQFSMANEPSMHIPYLFNYAGKPWRTQKLVRKLLSSWFRNDLMGMPGDEDGGGLSAFVVFSMMGFYPVTPGLPVYNIGSPVFSKVTIHLGAGRSFVIEADDASDDVKYIHSARINDKPLHQPWFRHSDMAAGGRLELKMSEKPNKQWGADSPPPSAEPFIPEPEGQRIEPYAKTKKK